jgi:hypothetical protein
MEDGILGKTAQSITIKTSPEKVWEILALDRLPEWDEGYGEHVEYTSNVNTSKDKYRVGAIAQEIPKNAEDNYCRFEIIESIENEKMKWYAWEKPKYLGIMSMFITYSLEPIGAATKFTYELESDKYGVMGIFGKVLEKLYFRRMVNKQIANALENLKNILES